MTTKGNTSGSTSTITTTTITEQDAETSSTRTKNNTGDTGADELQSSSKRDASWPSVLFYIHLNILGLYGITVLFTYTYFTTVIFTALLSFIGIIGVTCGAHRLWAHRTYEANTFLRFMLMLCQTMAGQVHYKFTIFSIFITLCTLYKKKKRKKTETES